MVYIVMYKKWVIESVWGTRKEAHDRKEWIDTHYGHEREPAYIQANELGECYLLPKKANNLSLLPPWGGLLRDADDLPW